MYCLKYLKDTLKIKYSIFILIFLFLPTFLSSLHNIAHWSYINFEVTLLNYRRKDKHNIRITLHAQKTKINLKHV